VNIVMELLRSRSASNPTQLAIVTPSREVSFENLLRQVLAASGKLKDLGVRENQTVLLLLPGYQNWVMSLALWRIGAIGISSSGQLETLASLKRFHWCVTAESDIPKSDGNEKSNLLGFSESWFEASTPPLFEDYQYQPEDLLRGISTSGSTGKNKIAAFTHRALQARINNLKSAWAGDKREYNFMPIGSTGGLSTALASLVTENPYYVLDTYQSLDLRFLAQQGIQELTGSPQQIGLLVRALAGTSRPDLTIERVKLAGSSISAKLFTQIQSVLAPTVLSIYGSTETGTIFHNALRTPDELSDLGQLASWAGYQIVDAEGEVVPPGTVGELRVRSDAMFAGYLTDCIELILEPRQEYFATGDQAVLSEGNLKFVGRFSDIINVAGEKINAVAVESFAKNIPGVLDAMCFASEDESGLGIHVMALSTSEGFEMAAFKKLVNAQFGRRAPSMIWLNSDLPTGELGKPARWVLEKQYRERRGL
jgi:acyl-coenzyme A synthetase/AMP-(fatty) acid ligase